MQDSVAHLFVIFSLRTLGCCVCWYVFVEMVDLTSFHDSLDVDFHFALVERSLS